MLCKFTYWVQSKYWEYSNPPPLPVSLSGYTDLFEFDHHQATFCLRSNSDLIFIFKWVKQLLGRSSLGFALKMKKSKKIAICCWCSTLSLSSIIMEPSQMTVLSAIATKINFAIKSGHWTVPCWFVELFTGKYLDWGSYCYIEIRKRCQISLVLEPFFQNLITN